MLRQVRQLESLVSIMPTITSTTSQYQQTRGMRLFELFSKEARAERKRQLKDDMQRGYFDDFREFRDTKGKVFRATEKLVPASHAPHFPGITATARDGSTQNFPPSAAASDAADSDSSSPQPAVTLVVAAYRAGAQPMVESWAVPFSQQHANNCQDVALFELALVEQPLMAFWPFRKAIIAAGAQSESKYAMPVKYLYHFGKTEELRNALGMTNRLTGYAFLLDQDAKVRWRGSGSPEEAELRSMLECSKQLLDESDSNVPGSGSGS